MTTSTASSTPRPFRVLGLQQIAVGGPDKARLRRLWVDLLGLAPHGSYRSEKENVDEDITVAGAGPFRVEVDLMQPLDPGKKPKVDEPPLNHVGLWVDDLPAAVKWLEAQGLRFAPGGIRKGAAGRSSTHSPTWLRGGSSTLGFLPGSSGCIRSTSTRKGPAPATVMSSSTFSFSLR